MDGEMEIDPAVIDFFENQNYVIVATFDPAGVIHCSAKGLAGFDKEGRLLVVDLYLQNTYKNLRKDPRVSITAIDEKGFTGYTLQGKAQIIPKGEIPAEFGDLWESRIIRRMSQRVVQGVQAQASSAAHHEAGLPQHPQYIMVIEVETIIDLSPPALRKHAE